MKSEFNLINTPLWSVGQMSAGVEKVSWLSSSTRWLRIMEDLGPTMTASSTSQPVAGI